MKIAIISFCHVRGIHEFPISLKELSVLKAYLSRREIVCPLAVYIGVIIFVRVFHLKQISVQMIPSLIQIAMAPVSQLVIAGYPAQLIRPDPYHLISFHPIISAPCLSFSISFLHASCFSASWLPPYAVLSVLTFFFSF